MKAIILKEYGGVENLQTVEIPIPVIKADEVLIKLKSISINPVDVKTRQGKGMAGRIKDPMPIILGWDISGVITEAGTEVTGFKAGDEVFSMIEFPKLANAYAEYVVAKPSELAIKPANINHDEAAAATLAALTAWQALTLHVTIKPGDRVLIQAAAGGVGHYAVQIAKHMGAYVIGTSSAANKDFILALGADEHIDYHAQSLEEAVKEVDFILDPIGADNTPLLLNIVKKGGTVISIMGGFTEALLQKAQHLGINAHNILVYPSGADMETIAGFLAKGIVKSTIYKTFPFHQLKEAHLEMEKGRAVGKITLAF
ncbi:NADP-dependent oxidoreductase [Mucilaginibacter flavus]|uniref:NADP-dependent oxidoreductase n=1 Tax=Mucilaginibacter flavus TaxID=931504 RepID=UPI0025B3AB91|nr:NADP-dependent oxidoreductase [Mucilaginibacter flavus]MDN3579511.1 NADP-dependent oxidoreductase [Mucilaginibacter flavus]